MHIAGIASDGSHTECDVEAYLSGELTGFTKYGSDFWLIVFQVHM